jgi:hypothetical protein
MSNYPLGLNDTAQLVFRYLTLSIAFDRSLALGILSTVGESLLICKVSRRHSISGVSIMSAMGCDMSVLPEGL